MSNMSMREESPDMWYAYEQAREDAKKILFVREYARSDFPELVRVYQSAFAEPPWDEFKKCIGCGVNYGVVEAKNKPENCKKCESPLELTDFWSAGDIKGDLDFAFSQKSPIALVGFNGDDYLCGFIWGYQLPFEKFPFLKGKIDERATYIDDVAVRAEARGRKIGKNLCKAYLSIAFGEKVNSPEAVLRTDQRNAASMGLFRAVGFKELGINDPEFPSRVYLGRKR